MFRKLKQTLAIYARVFLKLLENKHDSLDGKKISAEYLYATPKEIASILKIKEKEAVKFLTHGRPAIGMMVFGGKSYLEAVKLAYKEYKENEK